MPSNIDYNYCSSLFEREPRRAPPYLEVEDDGPNEAEYDGRPTIDEVSGVDVDQLDPLAGKEA